MVNGMNKRAAAVLFGVIMILSVTVLVIAYAEGFRPNWKERKIETTGILVATSDPVGASVFIDGKLETATNTTLNLVPGKYQVKIAKDGYFDWNKEIEIKNEEVFTTNAFLFPKAPDLRPITSNGAINPTLSPDETKIAYQVASASATANGIYTLSMSGLPVIANISARQIFRDNSLELSNTKNLIWSTDGSTLVASTSSRFYALEIDKMNSNPILISANDLALLTKPTEKLNNRVYSPDETKYLYIATESGTLPRVMTTYLPGTDPTPESRDLVKDSVYVYDIKEDRNYLISNFKLAARSSGTQISNLRWFPTSRHLVYFDKNEIGVMEYDGMNRAVVYTGPFVDNYVYVWPNWSKIIILTSLNQPSPTGENLYTINLR